MEKIIRLFTQCSVKNCTTPFHVTCAFEHSLELKTILDEGDEVKFKSYCLKHSKGKAGEAALSPARSKPPADAEKVGLRAQRLQELEEDFYTLVQLGEVSRELGLSERPADFIYQYWKLKRKSNFNKALLPPKEEEENVVLQPQEDSIHTRMRMFMHLRQDLERVSFVTIAFARCSCHVRVSCLLLPFSCLRLCFYYFSSCKPSASGLVRTLWFLALNDLFKNRMPSKMLSHFPRDKVQSCKSIRLNFRRGV